MAIAPLVKVTLYGTARQKSAVLHGLQTLGCLHLNDLTGTAGKTVPAEPTDHAAREALRYLLSCPARRRPESDPTKFDLASVRDETNAVAVRERELRDELDQLTQAVARLRPWGDFTPLDEGKLGSLRLWFYALPPHRIDELLKNARAWQVVSRDNQFAYVVVVNETALVGIPFANLELGTRSLEDLRRQIDQIDSELDELHWRRVGLTRWAEQLAQALNAADDRAARSRASTLVFDEAGVLAVSGWTPSDAVPRVREFAGTNALAILVEEPRLEESPPTLLRNPDYLKGGEEAVRLYTIPSYRAWDPSRVVFFSFALFFAMILADAGYAFVLGVGLSLFWRRIGRSDNGRQLRPLIVTLVVASLIYGVAVGSYFGLSPATGSYLERFRLFDLGDRGAMMRLAIGVGVAHLILAQLAAAWSRRPWTHALASVGWAAILVGGFLAGMAVTGAVAERLLQWGGVASTTGAVVVLLFSSDQPWVFGFAALGRRLLDGVLALSRVSQAFGDVLSYLRLFALGLASTQLAITFNNLAELAGCCVGIGTLLAILVLFVGHTLNLTLAVLGGVVHGLRLNCIEFFGWGLPEEGVPFRAFRKKAGL